MKGVVSENLGSITDSGFQKKDVETTGIRINLY